MPDISHALSPALTESIAGISAGIASTLVVHPLDIVKVRLQLNLQNASLRRINSFQIARSVFVNEGNLPAFYRGLVPSLVGNTVSWGCFFFLYGECKAIISHHVNDLPSASSRPAGDRNVSNLSAPQYFLASAVAGGVTTVISNPIWVLKTRMLSTGSQAPGAYTSMWDGATTVWRAEGLRGFYRGLIPSLIGNSHGAFQFMAYERLKQWRWRMRRRKAKRDLGLPSKGLDVLNNADYILLSSLSKFFAGSITYPYQVVRTRLQTYDAASTYTGAIDLMTRVWRREGIRGFYKGLGPSLLRVLPSTWVTFLVYENVRYYLPARERV